MKLEIFDPARDTFITFGSQNLNYSKGRIHTRKINNLFNTVFSVAVLSFGQDEPERIVFFPGFVVNAHVKLNIPGDNAVVVKDC